jgi:cellulose synthase/poly-beta-1,6-N-acetylglucosamine synthase-like glycosyltransferase
MDRIMSLKKVLQWVSSFSNIDIILVEQDSCSKIGHLNLPGRYIFAKNDGPYNRAWAFNIALKYNKNPIIAFGDSDLIMKPEGFIEAVNKLKEYDVVSPYSSVLDLNLEENNLSFEELLKINRPGRGETDNQKINICGGIVIFRTDAILKVGGWAESYFVGWGGEDDFQTFKVNKMELKSIEMPGKCFHFYHKKQEINQKAYTKMIMTLNKLVTLDSSKLQSHVNSVLPKIGMCNKYS